MIECRMMDVAPVARPTCTVRVVARTASGHETRTVRVDALAGTVCALRKRADVVRVSVGVAR